MKYIDSALVHYEAIKNMLTREVEELEAQYPFTVEYKIGYAQRYIKPQIIIRLMLPDENVQIAWLTTYASFLELSEEEALETIYLALHGLVDKYLIERDLCLKSC